MDPRFLTVHQVAELVEAPVEWVLDQSDPQRIGTSALKPRQTLGLEPVLFQPTDFPAPVGIQANNGNPVWDRDHVAAWRAKQALARVESGQAFDEWLADAVATAARL